MHVCINSIQSCGEGKMLPLVSLYASVSAFAPFGVNSLVAGVLVKSFPVTGARIRKFQVILSGVAASFHLQV